jgi:phage gp29-like protein
MSESLPKASKTTPGANKPVVIQNFVVSRPPQRTNFEIDTWRTALSYAEMDGGNRTRLYDLYSDILLDPHLTSQWSKRVMNVTNTDVLFTRDGKEIDTLSDLMDSPEFEELLSEIMNAVAWGITVVELGNKKVFEMGEEKLRLTIYSVERKHIRPLEGTIVAEQHGSNTEGIKYREGAYLNYVAEIGKPRDLGLLLKAAPYILLKKGGLSDWALFVQLFGQPFREFQYDGYDEATRVKLEQSAKEMGSAPYIILPSGAKITLHDIKTNPGGEVHNKLVEFIDQQISILTLGNTETTKSSKSSGYAQSQTHQKTQQEIFIADKKRVRRILNRVVRPILYNLGFDVKDGYFHFKEDVSVAERLDRIKLAGEVKKIGVPVADDYVYEESGIPKPDNYDQLKEEMQARSEDFDQDEDDPKEKTEKKKPKEKKKLRYIDQQVRKLRIALADFFDPAP